jgi:hypothetical protein
MNVVMYAAFAFLFLLAPEKLYAAEAICGHPAVIFCDDFESGNFSQWQDGYKPDRHTITSDPTNVFQGTKALQVHYPQGFDGGWLARWFMPGYDDVYVRLYVKWESNWRNTASGGDKTVGLYGNRIDNHWSGFGKAGIKPTGTDFFLGMVTSLSWHTRSNPGEMIFYSYYPDMEKAPDGMYWGSFFFQNAPRTGMKPGQWYCLEYELRVNTPGMRDGSQKMWIDGQLKGEVNNMRWRDTTDLRINAVQLSFSGGGPKTQHKWIDNVVVSTQKIGCVADSDATPPLD